MKQCVFLVGLRVQLSCLHREKLLLLPSGPSSQVQTIIFLTVSEAGSPRSSGQQCEFLQRAVGECLCPASPLASGSLVAVFGIFWLVDGITPISAFIPTWHSPCMCMSVSKLPLLYGHWSNWFRAHPNNLLLTKMITRSCFW